MQGIQGCKYSGSGHSSCGFSIFLIGNSEIIVESRSASPSLSSPEMVILAVDFVTEHLTKLTAL